MNGIETTVELFLMRTILPTKLDISYVAGCCRKILAKSCKYFAKVKSGNYRREQCLNTESLMKQQEFRCLR